MEQIDKQKQQISFLIKKVDELINECEDIRIELNKTLNSSNVKYLLVEVVDGNPFINGAKYFDTKEEIIKYIERLNLIKPQNINVEYRISEIEKS